MPKLGLDAPTEEIDKLFNEWDKGGDGALTLKEYKPDDPESKSTPACCAACSSAAGWTIVLLLLLGGGSYFGGGYAINRRRKGLRGAAALPRL